MGERICKYSFNNTITFYLKRQYDAQSMLISLEALNLKSGK